MPTKSEKVGKLSYHHPNLRQALLDQALVLVAETGGPYFSMRELAGRLGVSHAAVYRHFSDRSALLDALTACGFALLSDYQNKALAAAAPGPLERLISLGLAYITFAIENPSFFALLYNPRSDEATKDSGRDAHSEQVLTTLIDAIRTCQDEGILVPGDPRKLAGFMIMAPHGFSHYVAQGSQPRVSSELLPIFPDPETLLRIDLIPLMLDPPSSAEIAHHFAPSLDASAEE